MLAWLQYACVEPYFGWYEVKRLLAHAAAGFVQLSLVGLGFGAGYALLRNRVDD